MALPESNAVPMPLFTMRSERIGLTGVTVRRYLNYLTEKGILFSEIDYETGGRPCMRYRLSK